MNGFKIIKVIIQPFIYKGQRHCPVPFPTKNVYDDFPQLGYFTDVFKKELMVRYVNPKAKPRLCARIIDEEGICIQRDDLTLVMFYPSQNAKSRTDEICFFFHCVYLPLTWQFDLHWDTVKLLLTNVKGRLYASLAVSEGQCLVTEILNGPQVNNSFGNNDG